MKQYSFFKKEKTECGGELAFGKRKTGRALDSKKPIHLVLKSSKNHLFKNRVIILRILKKQANAKGLKIYRVSVQTNHVHLLVRIFSRRHYIEFIRAATGLIARQLGRGLWQLLPFTRIIASWGKDYRAACAYIFQNEMEVRSIWEYKPRRQGGAKKSIVAR